MRTDYGRTIAYRRIRRKLIFGLEGQIRDETLDAIEEALNERYYEPLEEEDILELFEMGASEEFVMVAQYDAGEVNTVRNTANRALEDDEFDPEKLDEFHRYLWEGDMYLATARSDPTNARILRETFGVVYLNAKTRLDADSPTPQRGFQLNEDEEVVFR